jgi:Protein of unknown function (DUF1475)
MNLVRIFVGVAGLTLLAVVLWASFAGADVHGAFLDQTGVLLTLPWGVAMLADLYVGFVLFAVIVFLAERSWLSAALWSIPLLFLGNIWAAVWLVLRLPSLIRRLNRPDLEP